MFFPDSFLSSVSFGFSASDPPVSTVDPVFRSLSISCVHFCVSSSFFSVLSDSCSEILSLSSCHVILPASAV